MPQSGPIIGTAILGYRQIREAKDLRNAVRVGRNAFPGMPAHLIKELYEGTTTPRFEQNGNLLIAGVPG